MHTWAWFVPHTVTSAATFVATLTLLGVCATTATAQTLIFSFSPQQYNIGTNSTITMKGYITNNTANTIFINDLSYSGGVGSGITYDKFFNYVPATLAPGASYGSVLSPVSIVDIVTNNAQAQSYTDNLTLLGGLTQEEKDLLAAANYSVTISSAFNVPETNSFTGFFLGTLTLVLTYAVGKRRSSKLHSTGNVPDA